MKKLFIVDAYPSSPAKMNTLLQCVNILKQSDYSIMVVSHCPVSEEIQRVVDYVVYDKNNIMLPSELTPFHVSSTDFFYAYIFYGGHSLAITKNMSNAMMIAIREMYDFFYFIEFDCLFSETDFLKMCSLQERMYAEEKKMIFFKPEKFREDGSYVYETLIFGGDVRFFCNRFLPPSTLDEWKEEDMQKTLELSFFKKFSDKEPSYLIINEHSHDYFNTSVINKYRYGAFVVEVLENKNFNDPTNVVLFISNANYVKESKTVRIYFNGQVSDVKKIVPSGWYFQKIYLSDIPVELKVCVHDHDSDVLEEERLFKLHIDEYDNYRNRGYFKHE